MRKLFTREEILDVILSGYDDEQSLAVYYGLSVNSIKSALNKLNINLSDLYAFAENFFDKDCWCLDQCYFIIAQEITKGTPSKEIKAIIRKMIGGMK